MEKTTGPSKVERISPTSPPSVERVDYSNDTATAVAKGPLTAIKRELGATGNADFGYFGDNVEIGAGCTIDRGAIENTIIHNGVKLDNLVHIAHNVILGENSAIAASCAIAGSTIIGKNLQMGGLSGILGHLEIADDVLIGAHTLITKSINESGNYVGIMPAQEHKDWAKSSVFIKRRISK